MNNEKILLQLAKAYLEIYEERENDANDIL